MASPERPSSGSSTTVDHYDDDDYTFSTHIRYKKPRGMDGNGTSPTTDTKKSRSRLRTHLSTYPLLSVPYRTLGTYTPFHILSRIIDSLPEIPASIDVTADSFLTQLDEAVDSRVRQPVMRGYDAVVTRPTEVIRTGAGAYWGKWRELIAGGLRYIETGVHIIGEHFLPEDDDEGEKTDAKEFESGEGDKETHVNGKSSTFSNYKAALLYGDASDSSGSEGEGDTDDARRKRASKKRKKSEDEGGTQNQSYKEALIQDSDAPGSSAPGGSGAEWPLAEEKENEDNLEKQPYKEALMQNSDAPGSSAPGGSGAEWPLMEEGRGAPAYDFEGSTAPGGSGAEWPQSSTSSQGRPQQAQPLQDSSQVTGNNNKKTKSKADVPTTKAQDPTEELLQLSNLLSVYATRVYARNSGKDPSQLFNGMRGLTKAKLQLPRDWFDEKYPIEQLYLRNMVEAGEKSAAAGDGKSGRITTDTKEDPQGGQMTPRDEERDGDRSGGGGGILGLTKWGVGMGTGFVANLIGRK